jgi:hypothetical protein
MRTINMNVLDIKEALEERGFDKYSDCETVYIAKLEEHKYITIDLDFTTLVWEVYDDVTDDYFAKAVTGVGSQYEELRRKCKRVSGTNILYALGYSNVEGIEF